MLFWLSDEQWAAIEPFMPKNQPGARRKDDGRIISGIFHVLKTGCRWQDCPAEYGPHTTVYNRFNRWSRKRLWTGMLEALAKAGAATNSVAIDSTYIKVQRSAFGAKGGQRAEDRPLTRRKHHQNPRPHRCSWPSVLPPAHCGQCP